MNLNQTEQEIYDFCITPRTAAEIMEFIGHKTPPYKSLRVLQRLDLIERISTYDRAKATFVQFGRPKKFDWYIKETPETCMVMGVRL